jgi:hypothetical protein
MFDHFHAFQFQHSIRAVTMNKYSLMKMASNYEQEYQHPVLNIACNGKHAQVMNF